MYSGPIQFNTIRQHTSLLRDFGPKFVWCMESWLVRNVLISPLATHTQEIYQKLIQPLQILTNYGFFRALKQDVFRCLCIMSASLLIKEPNQVCSSMEFLMRTNVITMDAEAICMVHVMYTLHTTPACPGPTLQQSWLGYSWCCMVWPYVDFKTTNFVPHTFSDFLDFQTDWCLLKGCKLKSDEKF